jgi:hypothetical protein
MHYILIIMLATGGYTKEPFATLDDCMARQQIVGGHCEAKSHGTNSGTDWVNPYKPKWPKLEEKRYIGTPVFSQEDVDNWRFRNLKANTDTPAIKAFKEGWKQEMQKPEPVTIMEQDI